MSDVLNSIATQIRSANANIDKAKTLIRFMDAAGENTAQHKLNLQTAEMKLEKYKTALKQEGIDV